MCQIKKYKMHKPFSINACNVWIVSCCWDVKCCCKAECWFVDVLSKIKISDFGRKVDRPWTIHTQPAVSRPALLSVQTLVSAVVAGQDRLQLFWFLIDGLGFGASAVIPVLQSSLWQAKACSSWAGQTMETGCCTMCVNIHSWPI